MQTSLTFDDVCLVPVFNNKFSSRSKTSTVTWLTKKIKMKIPLVAANMDTVIGDELADVLLKHGSVPIFHRFTDFKTQKTWAKKYPGGFISCGLNNEHLPHIYECLALGANLNIDVAHGHDFRVLELIKTVKKKFPKTQIIAGNVCTPDGVQDLALAGADAVKVGIGGGSRCTTRIVTGFGVPQWTAIQQCAAKGRQFGVPVIADGGIRNSGDIMKALGAGASSVMIGGLFAKTEESAAEFKTVDGKVMVKYRGMASKDFQDDFYGGVKKGTVAEGIVAWTECTGSADDLIETLVGGLRSGLTYGGSENIKEFHKKAQFTRVCNSYQKESKPRKDVV